MLSGMSTETTMSETEILSRPCWGVYDTCNITGWSPNLLYDRIHTGIIPSIKVGDTTAIPSPAIVALLTARRILHGKGQTDAAAA